MQGKHSFYALLTVLISLNLFATNLQAQEIQNAVKSHIETGTPIHFQFTNMH